MTPTPTYDGTRKLIDTPRYRIQINEAGAGHPVFLLHGSGPGATGWSNFAPNIPALAEKYRCVAVTMPGWGESTPQSLETGRDQSGAVIELMDTMGIERAAFVGNSGGGGIGLVMAGLYPERVSHVVTMGSGVWGPSVLAPGGLSEGMRAIFDAYQDPSEANFRRLVQVMCFDPAFASDELVAERARAARAFPDHLTNWLAMARAGVGGEEILRAAEQLPRTPVPALIIHGRDDRTVHWETSMRALALVPDSRMVLLNRCGHWAQLEHADEFNRLVDEFLTHH